VIRLSEDARRFFMKACVTLSRSCRAAAWAIGLSVVLLLGLLSTPARALTFPDVPATHPYAAAIQEMADHQIVNGKADGKFWPDDPVARQQFAKMIVLALGVQVWTVNTCPFTDVEHGLSPDDPLFPDKYVAVCASFGITTGVSSTIFHPYSSMSRAQLITMVARSLPLPEPPASYVPPFSNFDATHFPWARRAAYAGLLQGVWDPAGGNAQFWQTATRGEVCQVLHNLLIWRAQNRNAIFTDIEQAISASGLVSDDARLMTGEFAGKWASAIVTSPTRSDMSVLLEKGAAGWEALNAAANISYDEWLGLGAPQSSALLLSRQADVQNIRNALWNSGGFPRPLEVETWLLHGDYAGVVISSPGLDDCPVLVLHWTAEEYGTGLTYEDWIAAGAPADIATFLSGGPGD
jgi:hypothetical protein